MILIIFRIYLESFKSKLQKFVEIRPYEKLKIDIKKENIR